MHYFYQIIPHLLLSTALLLFFNIPFAEASVIIRPPNNLGLVGYWSFDEGRGTVTTDLSGSTNYGTLLNSPSWSLGKSRGGIDFDASGRRVTLDDPVGGSNISVSVWYKRAEAKSSGSWRTLLGHLTANIHHLIIHQSTREIGIFDGSWRSFGYTPPDDGLWHHYVVMYENGVGATLYVDGEYENEIVASLNLANNPIGSFGNWNSGNYWVGSIDEVRIYNRALSPTEIQSLYNNTKSAVVGETATDFYSDGLVAHYTFDGATLSGSTVSDVVGDNHGTIQGAAVPTMGRIGQALEFGSSGDYVQLPSSLEGILNGISEASLSMWVKLDSDQNNSGDAGIIQLSGQTSSNGNLYYYTDATREGGIWLDIFRTSRVFTGDWQPTFPGITWHHLVVTTTPGVNGWKMYLDGVLRYQTTGEAQVSVDSSLFGGFRIGQNSGGRRLGGKIDDVRIYNRALSAEEVRGLAGGGYGELNSSTDDLLRNGLEGFWTFDAETVNGSTVSDLSGGGNDGTIFGGTTTVAGKIKEAFSFDGVNGYVNLPSVNPTDAITVSAWVKSATTSYSGVWQFVSKYSAYIIGDNNNGNKQVCFLAYVAGGWRPSGYGTGTGCYTVDDPENWHHFTGVYDGTTIRFYVDGVLRATNSATGTINADTGPLHIAHRESAGIGSDHFNGQVDDIRIYSRALSEAEITQLYSMGQ